VHQLFFKILTCSQDLTEPKEVDEEEAQSSLALAITQEDFPKRCPGILCQDKVPSELSKDLFVALQKYVAMTREQCGRNFKMAQLGMQICTMVRWDHRKMEQLKIATKKGWPISSIDFKKIPGRIVKLQEQLHPVVHNKTFCEQQHVWKSFEADLAADRWTLTMFAKVQNSVLSSGSATMDHACAG